MSKFYLLMTRGERGVTKLMTQGGKGGQPNYIRHDQVGGRGGDRKEVQTYPLAHSASKILMDKTIMNKIVNLKYIE